ncbi:iron ABC transporter permease [Aeromicrobium sp. Leaf350]|uniref:FecCD family ABC transporter permease n=1 Tax=Aeromicrobium sp. Leaf350 TaxID=2876565 RepID=UPI001E3875AC|nr:iron chelate uptake ABC transporter family permease subunit [Aeromicrobium sp. Leaf350]
MTTTSSAPPASATPAPRPEHRSTAGLSAGLLVLLGVLLAVTFLSIVFGSRGVGFGTIWDAAFHHDPSNTDEVVIRDLRLPRTVLGLLAGAALGMAGAILQGLTRNALADPGIMGINSGAAAAVVISIMVVGQSDVTTYIWWAFVGAGVATTIVYGVASFGREGATPIKLALAGAAVSAGCYSITTGVTMVNADALNELRFWQVGSLAGRYWPIVEQTAPFLVAGVVIALFTGRWLNGLALGDDVATALGQRVGRTRGLLFVIVVLLAGGATAACGPIVFIGLVVPHMARAICGPDYRWIMTYSLLLSPIVLLTADILGRMIQFSGEVQVGVVLGLLGAPAFAFLIRRKNVAEL